MNNKCNFCKFDEQGSSLIPQYFDYDSDLGGFKTTLHIGMSGEYYIRNEHNGLSVASTNIKYCPMCGRKLSER